MIVKTVAQHRERYAKLHRMLDELVAEWISETGGLPSKATILDLMKWSSKQIVDPDDKHGKCAP